MQPSTTKVHINRPLTNISVAYMQSANNFIAGSVFPVVPVEKKSDSYFVYTKGDWFRDEFQVRASATESAGSGYNVGTENYNCVKLSLHKNIDDDTRRNSDLPLNPDRDATEFLTQRFLVKREKLWANKYFKNGVWATDITGVASSPSAGEVVKWGDYAASSPISNIDDGKEEILKKTGYEPNTLVLGYSVFKKLKEHPDVVDRLKYTSDESITEQMLAKRFGVERIFVAKAIENTGKEGETDAYSFVHGNQALLCYVAPRPSLLIPSAGYIFAWNGISDGMGETIAIKKFRMEAIESDRLEASFAQDQKVVASDMGYFFKDIV